MRSRSLIRTTLGVIFRIVLVTAIFTLLGFAIGLFCGIGAGVLYGLVRHMQPDMTMAYRFVAVPFAAMSLVITFCVMIFVEIRRLRRPLEFTDATPARRTS